jgi:hypothetical protein
MKTPIPGWPTEGESHTRSEAEKTTSRMAIWMLLIMVAVVLLGYLLVNRMLGI